MALYLLDKNKDGAAYLGDTLKEALENVQRCKQCRILTSDDTVESAQILQEIRVAYVLLKALQMF